jgi:hypothetical protein
VGQASVKLLQSLARSAQFLNRNSSSIIEVYVDDFCYAGQIFSCSSGELILTSCTIFSFNARINVVCRVADGGRNEKFARQNLRTMKMKSPQSIASITQD